MSQLLEELSDLRKTHQIMKFLNFFQSAALCFKIIASWIKAVDIASDI